MNELVHYTFQDTKITTLVDHTGFEIHQTIQEFIENIPSTISTIKLKPGSNLLEIFLDHVTLGLLNIKTILIDIHFEMTDLMINSFTRNGYQYHGATFKGATEKRQFTFIQQKNMKLLCKQQDGINWRYTIQQFHLI
ncbi:hypothetical protein DFA_09222 [Cavenderia fasciculata]|uniref:Uncharacterized protein n=1 Tax=Cavenderia fasciculata TaxID=261658 RepID=F4Q712_CACFS|nr:uncharacterized protein DFA_09222 [Cavenderia fasciculata]EGG16194.1 hypothetical protein DFA_09222 [Cavenderia fasciculata]|eukprot:XP_004354578.1 hypothetical protein DFA_09222 [Cavenderia fasciculata]